MYFTLRKAQSLIAKASGDLSKISTTELLRWRVILRDYIRYIETPDYERLLAGGYYANATTQASSGVVPVAPWLYTNLKFALDSVHLELKNRKDL